jgi:S1-C subfamily serine protease
MKLDFKNILIIFLVALLGGFIGTMGANELYDKDEPVETQNNQATTSIYKESSDLKTAIETAYDSVVRITSTTTSYDFFYREAQSQSAGSGVIISEDGYIVTNHHVVNGANEVTVYLINNTSYPAEVIGSDQKTDVALLKIDAKDDDICLRLDKSKGQMYVTMHQMLLQWKEQQAKLDSGEISQEEYDNWRYNYPISKLKK